MANFSVRPAFRGAIQEDPREPENHLDRSGRYAETYRTMTDGSLSRLERIKARCRLTAPAIDTRATSMAITGRR